MSQNVQSTVSEVQGSNILRIWDCSLEHWNSDLKQKTKGRAMLVQRVIYLSWYTLTYKTHRGTLLGSDDLPGVFLFADTW